MRLNERCNLRRGCSKHRGNGTYRLARRRVGTNKSTESPTSLGNLDYRGYLIL